MKNSIKISVTMLLMSNLSFGQNYTEKIDSIILKHYKYNPEVGISVGFISNNKEYYTAYGKIDKKSQIDINKNSIFEIASITKILTSNLIAQAVIEDKIKLDDYIDDYLPQNYTLNSNLKNKIKISDLASHQSGLPDLDFRKLIELDSQQPVASVTKNTLADILNSCTELIDYGKYRYSTIGYVLLGQILETVYNKSYDEIIREKIISPLQLTNTLTKDFDVKNITAGYNPNGGIQEFFNWNVTAPAGLVKSNASDMITYLKAVLTEDNTLARASAITERIFYKDENREMGLGTNIMTDDENTIYLKSGDSMGQSSIICYNRVKKWGMIILLNQRNSKLRQNLLNEIYESVLK